MYDILFKKMGRDERHRRFADFMNIPDSKISIMNANERIDFNQDPLYSRTPDESLQTKIRNRELDESGYWDAIFPHIEIDRSKWYLPPLKAQREGEDKKTPLTTLVRREGAHLIPTEIDPQTLVSSGISERYLLDACRKHALSLEQLQTLVEIKGEYQTNMPALLRLVGRGRSFEEIEAILAARDDITLWVNHDKLVHGIRYWPSVSLTTIDELQRRFGLPSDPGELAYAIREIHNTIGRPFVDMSLKQAIRLADRLGITSLDVVLDYVGGEDLSPIKSYNRR